MEGCQARYSAISQLFAEPASGTKSRFCDDQPHLAVEVICPKPRRATRAPPALDSLNRFCTLPKSIIAPCRGDFNLEVLETILTKDDEDLDPNNQMSFFIGSPPVRSTNPIVRDSLFVKQTLCQASPVGISPGPNPQMARAERVEIGSPSCCSSVGAKPKVRIEGFACGSSEPHCFLPALA